MAQKIPMVDFSVYNETMDESQLRKFGEEVIRAFRDVGFCYIYNHGIMENTIQAAFGASMDFFNMPLSTKQKYARTTSNTLDHYGFYEAGREQTDPELPFLDMKEAFDYLPASNKEQLPNDIQDFTISLDKLFVECSNLALKLMDVVAYGLHLSNKAFFRDHHKLIGLSGSQVTLRTLFYPSMEEAMEGQMGAGEHSDYGFMSFIFQDDVGGLEVKTRDGVFIPATPVKNCVVVLPGDMVSRWTSDKILPAKHRVTIPKSNPDHRQGRQSIVFFIQPDDKAVIQEIDNSGKYQPITSEEYIQMRYNLTTDLPVSK